jgi:hypothetical protein
MRTDSVLMGATSPHRFVPRKREVPPLHRRVAAHATTVALLIS